MARDGGTARWRTCRGPSAGRCGSHAHDERRPAFATEPLARLVGHAARGAGRHEGGPALRAELPSCLVLGPAAGAGQRMPSYLVIGQPRVADRVTAHRISRMLSIRLYLR